MDTLGKTLQDTEKEIGKVCLQEHNMYVYTLFMFFLSMGASVQLSEFKQCVERALEAKDLPLDVVLQCLSTREQRMSIDQVRDEVEGELHKV